MRKSPSISISVFLIMLSSCIMIPNNDFEWILPEIKGVVLDSLHHYPIENAKIVAISFRDTVYSDDKGLFIIDARSEYIKYRIYYIANLIIAMVDQPKSFIEIRIIKGGYTTKELTIPYRLEYKREEIVRIEPKTILLKNNKVP